MKKVNFYVREAGYSEGTGSAFSIAYEWKKDYPKELFLNQYNKLIEMVKKEYPTAEFVEVELTCKPTRGLTKETLMKVGQEVASTWGAVCTSVKPFLNSVRFNCNEYGENIETTLTYDEILKDYAYVL